MTPAAGTPDSLLDALLERAARRAAELVVAELDRRAESAEPRWLTVAEYAAARRCAPCTVREAIKAGLLPAERIGRHWRIRSDAQIAPRRSATDTASARVERLLASRRPLRAAGGGR